MAGNEPTRTLRVEKLTAEKFAPFGQVVDWRSVEGLEVNSGTAHKFPDLVDVDLDEDGQVAISLFRAQPRAFPLRLECLERHPLASQAFVPLAGRRFLVVVAQGEGATVSRRPDLSSVRAFLAEEGVGINFARGTWHHPLLAIDQSCDFLVVDRRAQTGRPNENLAEAPLEEIDIEIASPECEATDEDTDEDTAENGA